jgi:hypothetical protein
VRALVLVAMLSTGCFHTTVVHLERNAPGVIDVQTPPRTMVTTSWHGEAGSTHAPSVLAVGEVERPGDPGERSITLAFGGWAAYGWDRVKGGEFDGRGRLGAELAILYGSEDHSHSADMMFIYPALGPGLYLGWNWYDSREDATVGPLYLEVASPMIREHAVRAAAGVAWDPDDDRVGPQLTLSFLGIYLRGSLMWGGELPRTFMVEWGAAPELPVTFTWSK